jgi:NADH:ubiquinone oxidoreductase subunit E
MNEAPALYVCMGSACHQRLGYRLLPILEGLIARHGLTGRLVLKGAFCLENCPLGRALKFRDRVVAGLDDQQVESWFEREVLPAFPAE